MDWLWIVGAFAAGGVIVPIALVILLKMFPPMFFPW